MTRQYTQLEQILPNKVCLSVVRGDVSSRLFPTEESAIANSVEERRREFMTVRHCARCALHNLGAPVVALAPGPDRAPQWPDGVVGSMTHCIGYGAAAVGWRSDELTSIGIDAEPNEPLPKNVRSLASTADEWRMLLGLTSSCPDLAWDRLLFSAKEAVFKAWWPLTHTWLDFHQAKVELFLDGCFTVALSASCPFPHQWSGAWACDSDYITTTAWTRSASVTIAENTSW